MKSIILASVIFAGGVWAADEVADRTAIENTIRAFSVMPGRAGLYTDDFDRDELARLGKTSAVTVNGAGPVIINGVQSTVENGPMPITIDGVPGTLVISKAPMGEADWFPAGMATHAMIAVKKIRFVTAEVAMVDAADKSPVLIVMKKVGTDWKIASVRRLAEN